MAIELAILPKQFQNVNTSVINTNGKGTYVPLNTLTPKYYVRTTVVNSNTNDDNKKKGNK